VQGAVEDTQLLLHLADHTEAALPRLAAELGVTVGGHVQLFLARSAEDFRVLQPGQPPPWADGTAYPSLGAVFLRHPSLRGGLPRPLEQVLDHELVHVLLGRAFAPQRPPHWLQEGVAQVLAGEAGPETTARLSRALRGSSPISLASLAGGFPSDAGRAELAYAQTADLVQWLRVEHGEDAVRRLVASVRGGADLGGALHALTGQGLDEVDAAWKQRVVSRLPVWTAPDQLEAFLFAGGGLLILGVGFARRRGIRRRLATWQEERTALRRIGQEILAARHGPGGGPPG
ncbi:MAG: hypothetical protein H6732_12020, partial [Alphaproteobacteria bacterium]|nr:hypothetical protein [Alphaproteobacteria bacterium]